jgi:hypothetical protein
MVWIGFSGVLLPIGTISHDLVDDGAFVSGSALNQEFWRLGNR